MNIVIGSTIIYKLTIVHHAQHITTTDTHVMNMCSSIVVCMRYCSLLLNIIMNLYYECDCHNMYFDDNYHEW